MRRTVWIPEAPNHPGWYSMISVSSASATRDAINARCFDTREECQAWCDRNPEPKWKPVEHVFLGED